MEKIKFLQKKYKIVKYLSLKLCFTLTEKYKKIKNFKLLQM